MKRVLFVLPPTKQLYSNAKVKVAVSESPSLTVATLAAPLLKSGHDVLCLDLNLTTHPAETLERWLGELHPDYTGITFATPLFHNVQHIATLVKKYSPNSVVVVGGAHPTCLPESIMADPHVDIACIGEGDVTITEIVAGADLSSIRGIWYREDGKVVANSKREYINDLDQLPLPDWSLFNLSVYKTPSLSCRNNPVGTMETSRGCVFGCVYCNKSIFGRTFRTKSPQRIVDEMESLLLAGFKEIHIIDDGFTTNLDRAKSICDLIIQSRLRFPWKLCNGIRVDKVDREFLQKAKDAGCYSIAFGVESGSQTLLNNISKGTTLAQAQDAFRWCREIGIETVGFFMLGLPGETEYTMQQTIDFAKELAPDYAKTSILLPLPGTPLYESFEHNGYIKSKDWSLYNQHDPSGVYEHPNLDWGTIQHHYDLFYRRFYLRPSFIWNRIRKDAFTSNLYRDLVYFAQTRWWDSAR